MDTIRTEPVSKSVLSKLIGKFTGTGNTRQTIEAQQLEKNKQFGLARQLVSALKNETANDPLITQTGDWLGLESGAVMRVLETSRQEQLLAEGKPTKNDAPLRGALTRIQHGIDSGKSTAELKTEAATLGYQGLLSIILQIREDIKVPAGKKQ